MFDLMNKDRLKNFFDLETLTDFITPRHPLHMYIDIKESPYTYQFIVEVPGVKKENISVVMENDVLTITANKPEESLTEEVSFIRQERSFGEIRRSFTVNGVYDQSITARYDQGVLTITLPKKDISQQTIPITAD